MLHASDYSKRSNCVLWSCDTLLSHTPQGVATPPNKPMVINKLMWAKGKGILKAASNESLNFVQIY